MADIFQEVNESVQQDKWLNFFKKHQKRLSSLATSIIVITAIIVYWQHRQSEIRLEGSAKYSDAIFLSASGRNKTAMDVLEAIPEKSGHVYSDLSKLLGASILLKMDDQKGAEESYSAFLEKGKIKSLKPLATLKLVLLQADSAPVDQLIEKLRPLMKDNSPWRFISKEIAAHLHLNAGQADKAAPLFKSLLEDKKTPATIRSRVMMFQHKKGQ